MTGAPTSRKNSLADLVCSLREVDVKNSSSASCLTTVVTHSLTCHEAFDNEQRAHQKHAPTADNEPSLLQAPLRVLSSKPMQGVQQTGDGSPRSAPHWSMHDGHGQALMECLRFRRIGKRGLETTGARRQAIAPGPPDVLIGPCGRARRLTRQKLLSS